MDLGRTFLEKLFCLKLLHTRYKLGRDIKMENRAWNLLPWYEAEHFVGFLQNSLYKSSKKKDSRHIFEIRSRLEEDPRCWLLTFRNVFNENEFLFKQRFSEQAIGIDSCSILKFLEQKEISSLQNFKLVEICCSAQYKSLPFLTNSLGKEREKKDSKRSLEIQKRLSFFLTLEKQLSPKDVSFLKEKIFQIFPSKKSLQAFQFGSLIQLAKNEHSSLFFEVELEPFLEENLCPSSFLKTGNEKTRSGRGPKDSFFRLAKSLQTVLWNPIFVKNTTVLPGALKPFPFHWLRKNLTPLLTLLQTGGFPTQSGAGGSMATPALTSLEVSESSPQVGSMTKPTLSLALPPKGGPGGHTLTPNPDPQRGYQGVRGIKGTTPSLALPPKGGTGGYRTPCDPPKGSRLGRAIAPSKGVRGNRLGTLQSLQKKSPLPFAGRSMKPFVYLLKQIQRNISVNGFLKIKGFLRSALVSIYAINENNLISLSKAISENIQQISLLESFLVSDLEFDIKKWHKEASKKENDDERFSAIEKSENARHGPEWKKLFFLVEKKEFLCFFFPKTCFFPLESFLRSWFSKSLFLQSKKTELFFYSKLTKGFEFQNHVIRAVLNFQPRCKNRTVFQKPNSKNEIQALPKRKGVFPSEKERKEFRYKLEVFPSKDSRKKLFDRVRQILFRKKGNSAKSLILSLGPMLMCWSLSVFYMGNRSMIKKSLRRMDSILHFQLLRWVYHIHPNWSRQKIVEKYFPLGKTWLFQNAQHKENWVFSDSFPTKSNEKHLIFLFRFSWVLPILVCSKRRYLRRIYCSGNI
jgi:hypothetical protein